jgi:DNA-directed RNA polymerase specialized sigma24 family protein
MRDTIRTYVAGVLGVDDARVDEITDAVYDRVQQYHPQNQEGYLRRAAVNAARKALKRPAPVSIDAPEVLERASNPWPGIDRALTVRQVLARLHPTYRAVLWLLADGASLRVIAGEFGVSRTAAWRLVREAKRQFTAIYAG